MGPLRAGDQVGNVASFDRLELRIGDARQGGIVEMQLRIRDEQSGGAYAHITKRSVLGKGNTGSPPLFVNICAFWPGAVGGLTSWYSPLTFVIA